MFNFPVSLNTRNSYAVAFLAHVRQQFLPAAIYLPPAINNTDDKSSENDGFLWTPCAFWITSAHIKASCQDHSLLKTALLAIGMLLKSLEYGDPSLRVASLEMYRRCLVGIRRSIELLTAPNSKRPKDTMVLYLSCHAAAVFELTQNSDMTGTMHHLRAISNLMCHLGEDYDEYGNPVAWQLLQDYRWAEMSLCLKFRYASMMSHKHRQLEHASSGRQRSNRHSPKAHTSSRHHMPVIITDIADDITAIMVQADALRKQLKDYDTAAKLVRLINRLDRILSRYNPLYAQLVSRYGSAFVSIDSSEDDYALGYLKFKTFEIGAAWCYNLVTQAYCLETSIEIATLLSKLSRLATYRPSFPLHTESDGSIDGFIELLDGIRLDEKIHLLRGQHRNVCIQLSQCSQYFLQTDKGMIGQALAIFPLDTAASMIDSEMERLYADTQEVGHTPAILTSLAELQVARVVCRKMQARAQMFGLPSFYTAGLTETGGAQTVVTYESGNKLLCS